MLIFKSIDDLRLITKWRFKMEKRYYRTQETSLEEGMIPIMYRGDGDSRQTPSGGTHRGSYIEGVEGRVEGDDLARNYKQTPEE